MADIFFTIAFSLLTLAAAAGMVLFAMHAGTISVQIPLYLGAAGCTAMAARAVVDFFRMR